jgi:hypothetical protein
VGAILTPLEQTLRSLAAEIGLTTKVAVERLREAGIAASNQSRFDGRKLTRARKALGLDQAKLLSGDEMVVQLLGPLRRKGKVGKTHTTEFTNVWGHGVPPHQKDEARELAEQMIRDGLLEEKPSAGRRHVWMTERGLARLAAAERALSGGG